MFVNRRKALLVSAAVMGGAMLMTACQGTDSDAEQGASSAPPAASSGAAAGSAGASGSSGTTGNQSGSQGGNQATDQGGGQASTGQSSTGQAAAGTGSSGQGTNGGTTGTAAGTAAGTGTGTGTGKDGEVVQCYTADLSISALDNTISGDPQGSVAVEIENIGHDCVISGYAGVDLKTNAGSLSAKRTGEQSPTVTLKTGEKVAFAVSYPLNNSGGSGVRITGLVVTPPNETKSVTLPWPGAATLPVTDGTGAPVTVGPIGSAGQGG